MTEHEFALKLAQDAAERAGRPLPTASDELVIKISSCAKSAERVFNEG